MPSSLAEPSLLGDLAAHDLRHGSATFEAIWRMNDDLAEEGVGDDLRMLERAAKSYGLNSVNRPFCQWHNWLHSDRSLFLVAPDALHQWHKLFMDYPIEWAKSWLGNKEFD